MSRWDDLGKALGGHPPRGEPKRMWVQTATVTAVGAHTATVALAGGASVDLPFLLPAPTVGGVVLILAYGPARVILGQFG